MNIVRFLFIVTLVLSPQICADNYVNRIPMIGLSACALGMFGLLDVWSEKYQGTASMWFGWEAAHDGERQKFVCFLFPNIGIKSTHTNFRGEKSEIKLGFWVDRDGSIGGKIGCSILPLFLMYYGAKKLIA